MPLLITTPLPLSTAPDYYQRLVLEGIPSRGLLLDKRYTSQPREWHDRYLRLLHGAAVLDDPGLEPDPEMLTAVMRGWDQASLDAVDRLYLPLDQAALALASLPMDEHDRRMRAYQKRVGNDEALAGHPTHAWALAGVGVGLSKQGPGDTRYGFGPPVEELLTAVVAHGQSLSGGRMWAWRAIDRADHDRKVASGLQEYPAELEEVPDVADLVRQAAREAHPDRPDLAVGLWPLESWASPASLALAWPSDRDPHGDDPIPPDARMFRAREQRDARAQALAAALRQYDNTKAHIAVEAARRATARLTEEETG
ncbi:hypothetical protein [Streptomyces sp. NPDC094049]|uniref:hypothetical protein n=1 Tax=Streptomyces sp. NPDC094049 TaxID=3154987 RepID=UPI00332EDBB7